MDELEPIWEAEQEWLPLYRMWAERPMDYTEFHDRDTDQRGELPDVWR